MNTSYTIRQFIVIASFLSISTLVGHAQLTELLKLGDSYGFTAWTSIGAQTGSDDSTSRHDDKRVGAVGFNLKYGVKPFGYIRRVFDHQEYKCDSCSENNLQLKKDIYDSVNIAHISFAVGFLEEFGINAPPRDLDAEFNRVVRK